MMSIFGSAVISQLKMKVRVLDGVLSLLDDLLPYSFLPRLTSKRTPAQTIDSLKKGKIIHRRRGEKHLGKTQPSTKTNHHGSKRTTTTAAAAAVDLAYHYTSSEEDDALSSPNNLQGHTLRSLKCQEVDRLSLERRTNRPVPGPQVKVGTPSSLKLTRRNGPAGIRGGTPVRYSASMTPPPCLLRKLRQEGMAERGGREKYPRDDPPMLGWSSSMTAMEGHQSCRSSRSSLSTLTDDHVPPSTANNLQINGAEVQNQHPNGFHHHEIKPYDTYASLQRKFLTPSNNTRLSSPQISNRIENGCCPNRRLPQSVTSSPVANGHCHHTLERTIEMLKRDSVTISGDNGQSEGAEVKEAEMNEMANLRSTVDLLRDKVNRLSSPLSNARKQISNAIKEANDLRAEALNICEYAKTAQMTLQKLTAETESLLAWLRGVISCQNQKICSCSPAGPFQIGLCCSPGTIPQNSHQKCESPGGSLCKGKGIGKSLESILESSGYIGVPDCFAQKQSHHHRHHHRQRSADSVATESSELTSSDNETTKSVVHKAQYQKS